MNSDERVAALLKRCLENGAAVEIEGLGVFRRGDGGEIGFEPRTAVRVFIAYAAEDGPLAERLFEDLKTLGFDPWMDRRKLMPGQNWPRAIDQAISLADYFVACFSKHATVKRGCFQAELRYALDCAAHVPLDDIYFIPVRFEECSVPARIRQQYQYVDLFPDWREGVSRVAASMRRRLA